MKAQLSAPKGIAFGADGSLYIAISFSNRIRRVDPRGVITTVAGSGPIGGSEGYAGDGGPATHHRQSCWMGRET